MSETKGVSIQSVISGLLETGEYSDVSFVIGPEREEVKAHKIILASRSPVFKAMFSECWQGSDSSKRIEILDTDIDTFRSLLKFLYTDQLDEKQVPGSTKLLYLADKYDVQALLPKCDEILMTKFDLENCLESYQVAKACNRKDLQAWIEKQITKEFERFSKTQAFLRIEDRELLQSLLKRDDLNIEEVDLFQAIVRWGKARLNESGGEENEEGKKTLKSVLKDMFPLIRFPTMSSANFASIVRPTQLLPSEHMVDIFTYLASTKSQRSELGKALAYSTVSRKPVLALDDLCELEQQPPRLPPPQLARRDPFKRIMVFPRCASADQKRPGRGLL